MDIVLIPGFWLDASSWDPVVPVLEAAGHRTHPLTLPGGAGTTLRDHVDAVIAAVDGLADPAVLVGHSGGGSVAHAVVDARPERIARAVYVDSWPLGDGRSINSGLPAVDGEVPLPDWSFFDDADLADLDDGLRAAFRARAIRTPARVASDPQQLSDDPRRHAVPATVIACEASSAQLREWMAGGEEELAELARLQDVTWVDLPTGHWPQLTRPADLAEAIRAAVG